MMLHGFEALVSWFKHFNFDYCWECTFKDENNILLTNNNDNSTLVINFASHC